MLPVFRLPALLFSFNGVKIIVINCIHSVCIVAVLEHCNRSTVDPARRCSNSVHHNPVDAAVLALRAADGAEGVYAAAFDTKVAPEDAAMAAAHASACATAVAAFEVEAIGGLQASAYERELKTHTHKNNN